VSVDMLTTGFDVPATDTVVIARPTKSQNLYKQMVGRAMRLSDGKDEALLLDCGNVVKNLGMPLDKITEKVKGDSFYSCKKCSSKAPKKVKISQHRAYTYCPSCLGNEAEYSGEDVISCSKCLSLYSMNSHHENFTINADGIYLSCDCGLKERVIQHEPQILSDKKLFSKVKEMIETLGSKVYNPRCFKAAAVLVLQENPSYTADDVYLSKVDETSMFEDLNRFIDPIDLAVTYMNKWGKISKNIARKSAETRIKNYNKKNPNSHFTSGQLENFAKWIVRKEAKGV